MLFIFCLFLNEIAVEQKFYPDSKASFGSILVLVGISRGVFVVEALERYLGQFLVAG